jgi:hypothetical protein
MMPGTTAYMDTPVIPTQAFADGYNLPDCEYPDATPAIKKVVSSAVAGPWVRSATAAARATATITFANVSIGDSVTSVLAGSTTLTGGAITCNAASACPSGSQTGRNNRMATLVAASIAARSGITGITASASASTVTLTAVATGPTLNGTAVTVNQTGITVGGTLVFAGGANAASAAMALTITALGDKVVQNPAYSGPGSTTAPFNLRTITRHYGFGTAAGTVALVGSDGVSRPLTGVTWSDTIITGTVPSNLPNCSVQQRGAPAAQCGQLVITAANGKRSIDAITVTVGGKTPTLVAPTDVVDPKFGRILPSPLQNAIDAAAPGDLIIVGEGTYKENLLMWKPVRLQGVGAASVTINADAHPAGKMDSWRRQVNCLFGLALNGQPISASNPYDTGIYANDCPASMRQQVDRIPFEGILGWDVTVNGNLAEMLQEPTLMGAYEGAGVTVLGKGVAIPIDSNDYFGAANAGGYPDGYRWLNDTTDCARTSPESSTTVNNGIGRDYSSANFLCNPSRIDGLSVINSSQGGGAIFLHAWNHFLEVSNNRISANHGTLTGGITVGTGEFPDPFIIGGDVPPPYDNNPSIGLSTRADTGGPGTGAPLDAGEQAGYGFQRLVSVHHNSVTDNASIGDALFSGTPSGAGGVTFCVGSDYYKFNYNWICGNLSTGDGAGVVQSGISNGGDLSHNWILFNQSVNPTLPTNGGGVAIIGASPDRTLANGAECGAVTDLDCPPGLPEGTGRNLRIDANLMIGNSAESGTGGGLRLQNVNGTEIAAFPTSPGKWYGVNITNNVIANNVAGWDGGGASMQDALKVSFVNNTVASNDTTASAGSLFKTIGSAFASAPPPNCDPGTSPDATCYGPDAPNFKQPAGLVTMQHTPNLIGAMPASAVCPAGFGYASGNCKVLSIPSLKNDLFWQNRAFNLVLGGFGTGLQSQQHLVTLQPALDQQFTGDCPSGASYWDIGVRGDTTRSGANIFTVGNPRLHPTNSILTFLETDYVGNGNLAPAASPVNAQYCNGSRVPPENGGKGYNAPPGRPETTGLSPVFVLNGIAPAATVDEGTNWINLIYGPLGLFSTEGKAMVSDSTGQAVGAYSIKPGSPAVNAGASQLTGGVPDHDYFGAPRPVTQVDIGAVEVQASAEVATVLPAELGFGFVNVNTTSGVRTLTLTSGSSPLTVPVANIVITAPFTRSTTSPGTCATAGNILLPPSTPTVANSCTINVVFTPTAPGAANGSVTINATSGGPVQGSPVALNGTGVTPPTTVATVP